MRKVKYDSPPGAQKVVTLFSSAESQNAKVQPKVEFGKWWSIGNKVSDYSQNIETLTYNFPQ